MDKATEIADDAGKIFTGANSFTYKEKVKMVANLIRQHLAPEDVFILCEDTDMTFRSWPWPTGIVVTTEKQVQKFLATQINCRRDYYEGKLILPLPEPPKEDER